ncbi:MAG: type II toxin-antitoxin system VapC family toxin [Bacteroidetes bacterium]|nr:type II toxin-antitoxin system VapC family toxin [Bacteroidota bacterium]
MQYLLDTHTFLWFLNGDSQLSEQARVNIENPQSFNFISIASIWEISIKLSLGKLSLDLTLEELVKEIIKNNFEILPINIDHILQLSKLENHHKDPFDRILISQALCENFEIISKDINFALYPQLKISW